MSCRTPAEIRELAEDCQVDEKTKDAVRKAYAKGVRAGMRWLMFPTEPYPLDNTPITTPVVDGGWDFEDGTGP